MARPCSVAATERWWRAGLRHSGSCRVQMQFMMRHQSVQCMQPAHMYYVGIATTRDGDCLVKRAPAQQRGASRPSTRVQCCTVLVRSAQSCTPGHILVLANAPSPSWSVRPCTRPRTRSERALHLVSYEGVKAAGLDPFLVLLDRVLGLPPVNGYKAAVGVNAQPPSRVVAATSFLVRFVRTRSDEPTWLDFPCAQRIAEEQLLPLLPMTCSPFANWTAALNARERAAAATVAPGAHRWAWLARRCGLWGEGTAGGACATG